jgi:alkanesulfonate monooxygenase SsuD/methylene tetrahydromethanopterin reductase-like flavin-dependent oxidoreductase (luciferase family)
MGGPQRAPGEALAALEEAIQVMRLIWSGQRGARFQGRYYQLNGAHTGPTPAHPMEMWIGGTKPRMLALIGRLADGWIPSSSFVQPEQLPDMNRRIDEAAAEAGRDPGKIRRIYNVMGRITDGERGGFLEGPVDYWIEELLRLVQERGMDSFIFAPQDPTEDQIRRFAEQIAPEVRANR